MAWFQFHQGLYQHPKTLRLARALGVERVAAVGILAGLWDWALDFAQDGDMEDRFDEWADFLRSPSLDPEKLAEALEQTGWLDRDEHDRRVIHDWQEYGIKNLERRKMAVKRTQKSRAKEPVLRATYAQPTDNVRAGYASVTPLEERTVHETRGQRGETDPNGSCVPQAAHAAHAGADVLSNTDLPPASGLLAAQVTQEKASLTASVKGAPWYSSDGLAGPSAELSTSYPQKAYPDAFEALWKSAPQVARTRSGKPKAYAAWAKAIKRTHPEAIASGLEAFKVSWDWRKDAGAFVPGLHIWLGREVWDERPPTQEPHAGARGLASGSRGGVTGGFTDEFRAKLLERIEREKQTITVEVTDDRG